MGDIRPFLVEPAKKISFSESDMQHLSVRGKTHGWGQIMPTASDIKYKLCAQKMLMIDRITHVIPDGGAHGLGLIIGEKILERHHWYFPCHFKDDEVMAGSLVSDGCSQMLKVYMIWLGLHKTVSQEFAFRPVPGVGNKVRCRGQISPHKGKLVYVMEIVAMGYDKETGFPWAKANVDIIDINYEKGQSFGFKDLSLFGRGDMNRKIAVDFKGIALRMEGTPTSRHPVLRPPSTPIAPSKDLAVVKAFRGPSPPAQLMKYGAKTGAEFPLSWHPLAGKDCNPTPGFKQTAFAPRAVAFVPFPGNPNDNNHTPGELPLSWYNMSEFMCNKTSKCLGDDFKRFDNSTSSRSPAFDLCLVTRVLSVDNIEKGVFFNVDTNPGKGSMVSEFDCPQDAWFFCGSSSSDHMPYSIIMELALQTSGILTSWVKAPLTMDMDNVLFRNLDAKAELVKVVDLRGKTITNRSRVTSYSMLGEMGIHKFVGELLVDGEVFYKVDTSFGWFVPEVFEKQVGLDGGKKRNPWHLVEGKGVSGNKYDLTSASDTKKLFSNASRGELLRRSDQVKFLDHVEIISETGKYGKGYIHGSKQVNKQDWFFSCHFWCDPVMPGSLGVESMFECMEMFCIEQNVCSKLKHPRFVHAVGKTNWKYRGQLTPKNDRMDSEVHVRELTIHPDGSVDIVADAFLYLDKLRVYSTENMRLRVVEGSPPVRVKAGKASSLPAHMRSEKITGQLPLTPNSALEVTSETATAAMLTPNAAISAASSLPTVTRAPKRVGSQQVTGVAVTESLRDGLLDLKTPLFVNCSDKGRILSVSKESVLDSIEIFPCTPRDLGDRSFMDCYGVDYPLYTGAMAKGIASADLVIAAGRRKILASLGAGGLPLGLVVDALDKIQAALPNGPYAVNLIHSPFDDYLEKGCVDLLLQRQVRVVEASAFTHLTKHVVRYRVSGLCRGANGSVECKNKIIFKVSRTELAELALRPPPPSIVKALLASGDITKEQAEMAKLVPMCDDVAVESDSGGHTENRPMHVILPMIINLRDRIQAEEKFPAKVRVGAGGGIGCPQSVSAALSMGAAFVITGTVNQIAKQSGSCGFVRKVLSEATYSDVTMCPAADMFDQGVELQVLKKGTLFPSRAKKLFDLYTSYNSLDEIPEAEIKKLEKRVFKKSIAEVWSDTRNFYINRLKAPERVEKAETKDPKLKMSMTFRWYLKSSG